MKDNFKRSQEEFEEYEGQAGKETPKLAEEVSQGANPVELGEEEE